MGSELKDDYANARSIIMKMYKAGTITANERAELLQFIKGDNKQTITPNAVVTVEKDNNDRRAKFEAIQNIGVENILSSVDRHKDANNDRAVVIKSFKEGFITIEELNDDLIDSTAKINADMKMQVVTAPAPNQHLSPDVNPGGEHCNIAGIDLAAFPLFNNNEEAFNKVIRNAFETLNANGKEFKAVQNLATGNGDNVAGVGINPKVFRHLKDLQLNERHAPKG